MVGKIMQRSHFLPVLNYVLGKDRALLLDAEGISTISIESMAQGLELQSSMRSLVSKPVKHIVLAFHPNDKEALDNEKMVSLAKAYMEAMGYVDTPYIAVRHFDAQHPHLHLVLSRVANDGRTISDKYERLRNVQVCRELTERHGLYISPGKQAVRLERLRGLEKKRHELFFAIRQELECSKTWNELAQRLSRHDIRIEFKYKGATEVVEGVKFLRGDLSFSGSKVDRSLSYARITQNLANNRTQTKASSPQVTRHYRSEPSLAQLLRQFGAAMGGPIRSNREEEEEEKLKHEHHHDL